MIEAFNHNPFMVGYGADVFVADSELGHRFPGQNLVGRRRFISLAAVLRQVKTADTVVLCLGDSSTSGWNGDRVDPAGRVTGSPFFSYLTYCDLLAQHTDCVVINAGIPGYSSLQGLLYGRRLLGECRKRGVAVNVITTYFGNNDSTFGPEDKVRLQGAAATPGQLQRATADDLARNIAEICNLAQANGAQAAVVVPLVNLQWPPGLRSRLYPGERDRAFDALTEPRVRTGMYEAQLAWNRGEPERAIELDLVLPRIKRGHADAMRAVAHERGVALVDVDVEPDGHGWFADYCHPLEPANLLLARRIAEATGLRWEPARHIDDPPERPLRRVTNRARAVWQGIRRRMRTQAPTEPKIYPIY